MNRDPFCPECQPFTGACSHHAGTTLVQPPAVFTPPAVLPLDQFTFQPLDSDELRRLIAKGAESARELDKAVGSQFEADSAALNFILNGPGGP